ncbi:hypothetical protein [Mycoplasmoides pneumoniae]|uniref:hypothetical protein n=1 Tax=Mycoplasmoides pneumoniae TaxID=2104 RepID=UPI0006A6C1E0|nr:hypothetical protein [Mycoplasmoides pneumoniae]ALA36576.1 hypothetical protein F538_02010 [Mycoplasmoides pneumoniae M1139]
METQNQIETLRYIFNQLNNQDKPQIIWFSGEGEDEKINFLIRLDNYFQPTFVQDLTINFLPAFVKRNKKNPPNTLAKGNFVNIANKLLAVLARSLSWKQLNKPQQKWLLWLLVPFLLLRQLWLKKKVSKIFQFVNERGILSFIKEQWPILTTLVTVGTTLGTPIFSITISQQKAILENAGHGAFVFLVIFSVFAIALGLVSSLIFLVSSLFSIRQKKSLQQLHQILSRLINKYFCLANSEQNQTGRYQLKNTGVCFFYGFDFEEKEYITQAMNLLLLLKQTNCFVLVGCKESNMLLIKNKVEPDINLKQSSLYLDLKSQISPLAQISKYNLLFEELALDADMFYLEDFFALLKTPRQIVNFLFRIKQNLKEFHQPQTLWFDYLALWALVIATDFEFNNVLWSFNDYLSLTNKQKEDYASVNLTSFFNRSLKNHKDNSLLFKPELFNTHAYIPETYTQVTLENIDSDKRAQLVALNWFSQQKFSDFIEEKINFWQTQQAENKVFYLTLGERIFFLVLVNKKFKQIKLEAALKYLN